jgi:hypothetical protein
MNEFSILINLLSRPDPSNIDAFGATEDQLCDALGLSGRNKKLQLYILFEQFNRSLVIFEIKLRQNPLNEHWFLSQSSDVVELFQTNPFNNKERIGASLCTILLFTLGTGKPITIQEFQDLRGKKDVEDDLLTLEQQKFILRDQQYLFLHPNLGTYLDFDRLLQLMDLSVDQVSSKPLCKDSTGNNVP